jgi:hypothetical protein
MAASNSPGCNPSRRLAWCRGVSASLPRRKKSWREVARSFAWAIVLFACGPDVEYDGGESGAETGAEDGCPELILSGPPAVIFIQSVEEALSFPSYTKVETDLSINAPGLVDLQFLKCLTEVNGDLGIHGQDLESLSGLERLEVVSSYGNGFPARLTIWGNSKLESVDALANLRHADQLFIEDNNLLSSLGPLVSLETAEFVRISGNDSLTTIGLRQLVDAEVIAIGAFDPGIGDPGMLFCSDEADDFIAVGNNGLIGIDGLDSVESFGLLLIARNANLTSIEGILHLSAAHDANSMVAVGFNPSLDYFHILEVEDAFGHDFFRICSNLNDPEVCPCSP